MHGPILDRNPITWTLRQLREMLPEMESAAGFKDIGGEIGTLVVLGILGDVEAVERKRFSKGRLAVKHRRGTDISR